MRRCLFTPYLAAYAGDPSLLKEHLQTCESCRIVSLVIATTKSHGPTKDCPEPTILAAYDEELLGADEQQRIEEHVLTCGHCLSNIAAARAAQADQTEMQELLRTAEHEAGAYALAVDLSTWLSTEEYPQEREAVIAALPLAYDRGIASSGTEDDALVLAGLHFSPPTSMTLAQRIVLLSVVAGTLRRDKRLSSAEIGDLMERHGVTLVAKGFSQDLVTAAISRLRAR